MKILVTGAEGFVGRNLISSLKSFPDCDVLSYDKNQTIEDLKAFTKECEFVVHLAGVNRPTNPDEFYQGNAGFTETLCSLLLENQNKAPILISSSIQASRDNDYGKSKKEGEKILLEHGEKNQSEIYIYRLANLFGKWCRPNYNSVIATWCYNIANGLEISVNDETAVLSLCYIDDVVNEFINCIHKRANKSNGEYTVPVIYEATLGKLKELLYSFKESRSNLNIPNMADGLEKKLYATYLSYLPTDQFSYALKMNVDPRGSFTEFIKSEERGQVSVNISKPNIVKGNHWHHTKNEKFLVVQGKGIIRFRNIFEKEVISYEVSGDKLEVVDIPCGFTHNIENIGETDMVTIMWANETFDPEHPDTFYEEV